MMSMTSLMRVPALVPAVAWPPAHLWIPPLAAVAGLLTALVAFVRDPAAGTRRCPRCWHWMTGIAGRTCPACGHAARRERSLHRRRRRLGLSALGLLVAIAAAGTMLGLEIRARGGA